MTDIKKPPRKKKVNRTPPQLEEPTPQNLKKPSKSELVNMNLSVSAEFRREYKTYAADHDMTMTEILQKSFELFKEHNR